MCKVIGCLIRQAPDSRRDFGSNLDPVEERFESGIIDFDVPVSLSYWLRDTERSTV
jgi:hypothetical protein